MPPSIHPAGVDQHTAAGAAAASGVGAPVLRDTGDCTWTAGGLRTHGRWIWLRAGARICTPPPGPRRRLTPRVHLTPRHSKPPGTRSGSAGWCGPLCKGHAQDGQVRRKDVAARPVDVVRGATKNFPSTPLAPQGVWGNVNIKINLVGEPYGPQSSPRVGPQVHRALQLS